MSDSCKPVPLSDVNDKAYALILEKIEGGVIVLDGQARVVIWNQWLEKTSGISIRQAQGQKLDELFPQLGKKRLISCVEQCLSQGMSSYLSPTLNRDLFPLSRRGPEGQKAEMIRQLVYIKPIDQYSSHRGCFIQIIDVTSAIKRETAMRLQAEKLEQSNLDLSQFAYVASHDLQEPLRTICGFGDILTQNYQHNLPPEGQDFLRRIVKGARRLQAMISDLLVFSKVSTEKTTCSKLNLNEIFDMVLEQLDVRIQETGAICTVEPLPEICGEKSQISRLFQNLLGNSLKFIENSKSPEITIYSQDATSEEVYGDDPEKYVTICVRDNGIGFEQCYVPQIFNPFERLHSHQTYPGNGLGLAICRRIVEKHNGFITAEGIPGRGALLKITLPLS